MPDENRSDALPFSSENEPPLQRAVLDLLLEIAPKQVSFYRLSEYEQFRDCDSKALLSAVKSLHIAGLVHVDAKGLLVASSMAKHVHWLLTEVEPLDG
jgi:hypothetical protein